MYCMQCLRFGRNNNSKKIQYILKLSISDYDKIHSKAQQTIKIKEHDIQALKMKKNHE